MSDIYISKIHGAKIRDEELTQRFEESQKKASKFSNIKVGVPYDTISTLKVGTPARCAFYAYRLDYDGISYNLSNADDCKSLKAALENDYPEIAEKWYYEFPRDIQIETDKFYLNDGFDDGFDDGKSKLLEMVNADLKGDLNAIEFLGSRETGVVTGVYVHMRNVRGTIVAAMLNQMTAVILVGGVPGMAYCVYSPTNS